MSKLNKGVAKTDVLSLRVSNELNSAYSKLSNIYGVTSQELMRMALGKFMTENLKLIKEYDEQLSNTFKPEILKKDEWINIGSCTKGCIKWTLNKYSEPVFTLAETFSDGGFLVTEAICRESLDELVNTLNQLKRSGEEIIYDNDFSIDGEELEETIIRELCIQSGVKVMSKHLSRYDKAVELLEEYIGMEA